MSYADHFATSRRPGDSGLRKYRNFRWLMGGPAELSPTQIQARPRCALGATICSTVATSAGSWEGQRSRVLRRSHRDLAAPRGLRSAELSPLSLAQITSRPRCASGAATYAIVANLVLLGAPPQWRPTQITLRPRRASGTANRATVATFVSSWEGQRSGVLRRPNRDLAVP